MRPRTLLLNALLLSLFASGWGSVLVAAFCPHEVKPIAEMSAHHDCCRAKLAAEPEHCAADTSAAHEAMAMDEMEAMPPVMESAADALALGPPDGTCLHCVSRSGLPTPLVATRELEQKRRSVIISAPPAPKLSILPVASFTPTQTLNRGAPPGATPRRHLLFSIFVI